MRRPGGEHPEPPKLLKALLSELGKEKGAWTLRWAKWLIKTLGLEVDGNHDDLELAQFETIVVNQVLIHYEQVAGEDNHVWQMTDGVYAGEAALKAYEAFTMWQRSRNRYYQATWMAQLMKVLWLLVKELKRRA